MEYISHSPFTIDFFAFFIDLLCSCSQFSVFWPLHYSCMCLATAFIGVRGIWASFQDYYVSSVIMVLSVEFYNIPEIQTQNHKKYFKFRHLGIKHLYRSWYLYMFYNVNWDLLCRSLRDINNFLREMKA